MDPIYCIMITGKDETRIKYAKQSVINFLNQSHTNKKLIIMNHGSTRINELVNHNIFEFSFDISKINLGTVRNIALNLVPINALWTTWDDDDYRHPSYLKLLCSNLTRNYIAVSFKNRIDFYKKTEFKQISHMKTGFVTLVCRKDPRITYLAKNTMEDLELLESIKRLGDINVINNDPLLYIRIVHNNNTSTYVNNEKRNIINYSGNYTESSITTDLDIKIDEILENEFRVY